MEGTFQQSRGNFSWKCSVHWVSIAHRHDDTIPIKVNHCTINVAIRGNVQHWNLLVYDASDLVSKLCVNAQRVPIGSSFRLFLSAKCLNPLSHSQFAFDHRSTLAAISSSMWPTKYSPHSSHVGSKFQSKIWFSIFWPKWIICIIWQFPSFIGIQAFIWPTFKFGNKSRIILYLVRLS